MFVVQNERKKSIMSSYHVCFITEEIVNDYEKD